MFTRSGYTTGFAHVHEVHFDEKPDGNVVHSLINRYFGGPSGAELVSAVTRPDAPLHQWRYRLSGNSGLSPNGASARIIEAALDRDTFCGTRKEPFYFLIRNEEGDDAITLAIARGLAEFIAKEMNGKLVSKQPQPS